MQDVKNQKSKGHIAFCGDFEFYQAGGDVYRGNRLNVLDIDGYRHARWECSAEHFERYKKVILGQG